jgi:hypothetical protein
MTGGCSTGSRSSAILIRLFTTLRRTEATLLKLLEFTMPSMDGELRITTDKIGKEITGKLLRPCAFEAVIAISLDTGVFAVAITIFPTAADPEFKEPVIILLAEEDVDPFIRAIRIAQAGTPLDVRKGASA